MNNTLCLGIFAVLVYARDLDWEFSAGGCGCDVTMWEWLYMLQYIYISEVTVIIFIEVFVGAVALISGFVFKNTYYVSYSN